MPGPRSYIVRIYRQGFASLVGVVEDADTAGSRSFSSLAELGALLVAPIPPGPSPVDAPIDDDTLPPGE